LFDDKRIHVPFRYCIMKNIILFFIGLTAAHVLAAQDTLPKFSVQNMGNNRILLGWTNSFENIKQISIQRSYDSTRNFKTILTVPDPVLPENGYLDSKAPSDRMFYRLYIMLDKGVFLFSDTKRPFFDSSLVKKGAPAKAGNISSAQPLTTEANTGPATVTAKPKVDAWEASKYIYTLKDGYIRITLPEAGTKKYLIKFFTSTNDPLFELKDVVEKSFKIDKSNFYKAGWFNFELYEDGTLKEKNKFFLPKEF
jgi:hypothetical protein